MLLLFQYREGHAARHIYFRGYDVHGSKRRGYVGYRGSHGVGFSINGGNRVKGSAGDIDTVCERVDIDAIGRVTNGNRGGYYTGLVEDSDR